ncbi:hypothetical protein DL93DRAFT_2096174 [Clavulina sp. PMI_390]|nr:hypothetical protein DL93DRAFT_2096174 [Clavulina sp. PMI_390]
MFARFVLLFLAATSIFSLVFAVPIVRDDSNTDLSSILLTLVSDINVEMDTKQDPATLVGNVCTFIQEVNDQVGNLDVGVDGAGVGASLSVSFPALISTISTLIQRIQSESASQALVSKLISALIKLVSAILNVGKLSSILQLIFGKILENALSESALLLAQILAGMGTNGVNGVNL